MDLDDAIEVAADRAFRLLERLVAQPSTLGHEGGAQEVFAHELEAAGFTTTRLAIPDDIGADEFAGVPQLSYAGRYDLVGQRGDRNAGRSLVINGHMDVVPADDPSRWTSPPFTPTRVDGWLVGRGAGDMKGGFAAGLLAIWALDQSHPGWQTGGLTVVSAIEEEATGNGTLAAGRAGYLGDAALLLEPTDLEILLGGISIIWISIEIEGLSGHAESAQRSVNPILATLPIIDALLRFEEQMNADHSAGPDSDPAFSAIAHPYNVNVGKFHAGDWASSVPSIARLDVRIGHPASWDSDVALTRVRAAIERASTGDEWLAAHPPSVALTGYRAQRYMQDPAADVVAILSDAHEDAHGFAPARVTIGSTTDARFYLNQFNVPALAYGPRTRNMHGADEAVDLSSIVECAKTVARFLLAWYRDGTAQ
jgi:acetylornithine deacetylase